MEVLYQLSYPGAALTIAPSRRRYASVVCALVPDSRRRVCLLLRVRLALGLAGVLVDDRVLRALLPDRVWHGHSPRRSLDGYPREGVVNAARRPLSGRVNIPPNGNGTATAACPNGSEAVSGGFAAPGFDPTAVGPGNLSFVSRRVHRDKWTAAAHNLGGAEGRLLSHAHCAKHGPGLEVASKRPRFSQPATGVRGEVPPRHRGGFRWFREPERRPEAPLAICVPLRAG